MLRKKWSHWVLLATFLVGLGIYGSVASKIPLEANSMSATASQALMPNNQDEKSGYTS